MYFKSIKKLWCLFMVLGSSVGMMDAGDLIKKAQEADEAADKARIAAAEAYETAETEEALSTADELGAKAITALTAAKENWKEIALAAQKTPEEAKETKEQQQNCCLIS